MQEIEKPQITLYDQIQQDYQKALVIISELKEGGAKIS